MIAVDTSAPMAVVRKEPTYRACIDALSAQPRVLLSAGTAAEALLVAFHGGLAEQMEA